MGLMQLRCPLCNSDKLEARTINGTPGYFCPHCGKEFLEEVGIREYEKLEAMIKSGLGSVVDEALLNSRMEKYYNLRSLLYGKITAMYTDSAAIVNICRDILAIAQHDFLAEFFELANSGTSIEIAEYIQKIDEKENSALIDLVLDFIIKSLEEEYITPTAALLDRCSRILTPEKKQDLTTRFESEVNKIANGMYETSVDRDVFLAYSSKDISSVVKILNFIESQGLTCFAAFRNLKHGRDAVANYERALEDAIDHCSIFVFVSSANSRNFGCDAFKKEIAYIRSSEMNLHREYRSYEQLPDKYKKLRIEYRIDNKPTPPLVAKTLKDFFAGLTYVEDYDQLCDLLADCMDIISNPYIEEEEPVRPQPEPSPAFNMSDPEALAKMIRMINEETRKAEEESKRKAEEEARHRAEAEAKRKAEEEAKRRAEKEAKRRAEEEARRKAEAEAKRQAEFEKSFTLEGTKLVKYIGSESEVVIPNFITEIGDEAFYSCESLVSVTIPSSVTSIGNSAFFWCGSLTSVTIPNSVVDLGYAVFYECSGLGSLTIGSGIKNIYEDVFSGCSALTSITVDKDNKYYKDVNGNLYTKDGKTLLQYAIGKKDSKFTIPDRVEDIGNYAFSHSKNLINVTIPNSVKSIGRNAFDYCSGLVSVTVPDSVTSIGKNAFEYCSDITSVTIGSGVKSIGSDAFQWCGSLKAVYYNGTESEWNNVNTASSNTKLTSTTRYHYSKDEPTEGGKFWHYVKGEITIWPTCGLKYTLNNDGVSYSIIGIGACTDKDIIIPSTYNGRPVTSIETDAFYSCSGITSVTIPDSVKSIGDKAFYYCSSLKSVTIGNGVNSIGISAFYGCSDLVSATIGNSVNSIGEWAFAYCKSLSSLTLPSRVTSLGDWAFRECSGLTSVTIPNNVKSIGDATFAYCSNLASITVDKKNEYYKDIDGNLYTEDGKALIKYAEGKKDSQVVIPGEVKKICDHAFPGFYKLKDAYYVGTERDWNNVSIGSFNYKLSGDTPYYYSKIKPVKAGRYWHYVDGIPTVW